MHDYFCVVLVFGGSIINTCQHKYIRPTDENLNIGFNAMEVLSAIYSIVFFSYVLDKYIV